MKELWTEKYRPKTLNEYVFRDSQQEEQARSWVEQKTIPHLLFSGSAGIGKTTLAKILINELDIPQLDVLEINASRERGIEEVRKKITNFVNLIPYGEFKVVILDEADYLTPEAQASLRGVMEECHKTARMILTCNYPNKIIPAIHSRCQGFHIPKIDQTEFTARAATILVEENVTFDLESLDKIVKMTFPDLRKCINTLQMNSIDKILKSPNDNDSIEPDYKLEMVELFQKGDIKSARKLLCSQARPEEMVSIYRWLYENINLFGNDAQQEKAILIIKQGLVDHTLVQDPEINLAATLIKLAHVTD
ncbi:AAA family ATPase [bacterium]|nr:AAA family ATPase [Actinomycetota bacterium]NDG30398.1 AAA family ATPase [bacterium]